MHSIGNLSNSTLRYHEHTPHSSLDSSCALYWLMWMDNNATDDHNHYHHPRDVDRTDVRLNKSNDNVSTLL